MTANIILVSSHLRLVVVALGICYIFQKNSKRLSIITEKCKPCKLEACVVCANGLYGTVLKRRF